METVNNEKLSGQHQPQCETCEIISKDVTFAPNPFQEEIYGDHTNVWMCSICRYESSQDI